MKRTVELTADGSNTIAIEEMNVTYHSRHGAVQESMHVFIDAGLKYVLNKFPHDTINIFEMGFGTGLNALLTMQCAVELQRKVSYYAVDEFPLIKEEYSLLDYKPLECLKSLHECEWEKDVVINSFFTLNKSKTSLVNAKPGRKFHLIYYDAFAPAAQPELWTKEIFDQMYSFLVDEGIMVTYCSKGDVRRAMMAAGFTVEKLPGPKGKREMLRGVKPGKAG